MNRKLYSRFGAIKERKIDWSKREFVNESKIQSKIKMKSDRTPINLDDSPAGALAGNWTSCVVSVCPSGNCVDLLLQRE